MADRKIPANACFLDLCVSYHLIEQFQGLVILKSAIDLEPGKVI